MVLRSMSQPRRPAHGNEARTGLLQAVRDLAEDLPALRRPLHRPQLEIDSLRRRRVPPRLERPPSAGSRNVRWTTSTKRSYVRCARCVQTLPTLLVGQPSPGEPE